MVSSTDHFRLEGNGAPLQTGGYGSITSDWDRGGWGGWSITSDWVGDGESLQAGGEWENHFRMERTRESLQTREWSITSDWVGMGGLQVWDISTDSKVMLGLQKKRGWEASSCWNTQMIKTRGCTYSYCSTQGYSKYFITVIPNCDPINLVISHVPVNSS